MKNLNFCNLKKTRDGPTDGLTDGPTDGRADRPSYRDARTHLKISILRVQWPCAVKTVRGALNQPNTVFSSFLSLPTLSLSLIHGHLVIVILSLSPCHCHLFIDIIAILFLSILPLSFSSCHHRYLIIMLSTCHHHLIIIVAVIFSRARPSSPWVKQYLGPLVLGSSSTWGFQS